MTTMHVDVVSAEESIFGGDAEFVVLPGEAGELGIYPRHAPLITRIRPGVVRIRVPGRTEEEQVFVAGGILEVQPHVVTVLTLTADVLEAGDKSVCRWLEMYKACERSGVWPGYVQTAETWELDEWQRGAELQ